MKNYALFHVNHKTGERHRYAPESFPATSKEEAEKQALECRQAGAASATDDEWTTEAHPLPEFQFPQYRIEFQPRKGSYAVGILRENGGSVSLGQEFPTLDKARDYVYSQDPKAIPTVS